MNKDAPSKDIYSETRDKILRAAQERLWHYGFKKTTIDEIAADAGVGKGTIYLHFSSKEEIALEIIAQIKRRNLDALRVLAANHSRPMLARITDILMQPVLMANRSCSQSPAALEMVAYIKPTIQAHIQPLLDQEVAILAGVLDEGNHAGIFDIEDTTAAARTLKHMCAGLMPPYPCADGETEITKAVEAIAQMAFYGLHSSTHKATIKAVA